MMQNTVASKTLCGSFDPSIDFAAKHPEINWLGEKRFGTGLQGVAFCFCIAVGSNHDDRDVRSNRFSLGQQFKAGHSRPVSSVRFRMLQQEFSRRCILKMVVLMQPRKFGASNSDEELIALSQEPRLPSRQ